MMGEKTSIKDVFIQSQEGMQRHDTLIKTLHKIYEKTEFAEFWGEFNHYLKYAMIVFKREPAVERVINFVSKFVPSLSKKVLDMPEDEEDSVADNRLLQEMFDFLLDSHSAKDRGVRFRCCQLINKLLTNLGEDAQIDDELYDRLYECMLERLKDKCPVVRYHAVLAMARLQDPQDENCPVIRAYLFLLNCDPNPDVRRAVLTSIAPSTKTMSSIVSRTRDVKDVVQKTAYEILSEKIHIKVLSIALRLQLLDEGLESRSEIVRLACSEKLLKAWMKTFDGNPLLLLKSLDVEDSTDICSKVLETLFKSSTPQDVIERFDILNEKLLIEEADLNSESVLYWQAVCQYFHKMGLEGEEYKDKVMPTAVDFAAYVASYVDELKTVDDPEIQLGREFIIEQLLIITSYMDTADSASRQALEMLLHKMLMADHVSHRLVKSVITHICVVKGTSDTLVPYFAEMVSEIREPITVIEKDIEEEQKRQINLKVAGIRVQLNQLREDLDDAVKDQDFNKAAEIKSSIAQLDTEKRDLLETSEATREEVRTERNDPVTLLKCQTIILEMLQILKLLTLSPTLQMMIETQIVPGIQNEDAEIRNTAMHALGLCCYLSKDLLITYIPLFMQASQIDVEGVRVTALQALFDLLIIFGIEIIDSSESSSTASTEVTSSIDDGESAVSTDNRNGTAGKLVAIICSFLDGESSDLRTCAAEGLSKLLLSGRVVSSKILSHLLLLWYNPLSEDDTHLRACLGTFFPLYALASRSNQEVVEAAFLPTLHTLLNAPATSPLAEVDVNNVAELLVQLTNTKLLTVNQNVADMSQRFSVSYNKETLDNPGHDNLSETVCNEVLSDPTSPHIKLWVKILNQMEVSPDNEVVLKDLRILCYKMVKLVKDRVCLKSLEKFQATITELASKFVSNDEDLANIEIEQPEPSVETDISDTMLETADSTQTPRRKRVRGLYSQNLTLDLETESGLDITEESIVDVDASCLMSRVSVSSETAAKRSRKNTATTEFANDEVFAIPEVPTTRRQSTVKEVPDSVTDIDNGEEEDQEDDQSQEIATTTSTQSPTKPDGTDDEDVSPKPESPVKSTSEKAATSPKTKLPRSKGQQDKVSELEKSPKVTSQDRGRLLKSGNESAASSPLKRGASKSPIAASPGKRRVSASSMKIQEKRKASKSPARDRKRMSKSPDSKVTKTSNPEKRKLQKSPIEESPKKSSTSPKKNTKGPVKSTGSTASPTKAPAAKKVAKASDINKPDKSKKKAGTDTDKLPSPVKKTTITSPSKSSTADKGRNVRTAAAKTMDSPRTARAKSAKVVVSNNDKSSADMRLAASPRNARRVAGKTKPSVTTTPEVSVRRAARTVLDTPETQSPSKKRKTAVADSSVGETPEHQLKKTDGGGKSGTRRTSVRTPLEAAKTSRATRASPRTTPEPSVARKPVKRGTASSTGSQSDASPVKQHAVKATAAGQNKAVSVGNDSDDEVTIKRRARPSRRSSNVSRQIATPPASRSSQASVSVASLVVASPASTSLPSSARSVRSSRTQSPSQASPSQASSTRSTRTPLSQSQASPSQASSARSVRSSRTQSPSQASPSQASSTRSTRTPLSLASPSQASSTRSTRTPVSQASPSQASSTRSTRTPLSQSSLASPALRSPRKKPAAKEVGKAVAKPSRIATTKGGVRSTGSASSSLSLISTQTSSLKSSSTASSKTSSRPVSKSVSSKSSIPTRQPATARSRSTTTKSDRSDTTNKVTRVGTTRSASRDSQMKRTARSKTSSK